MLDLSTENLEGYGYQALQEEPLALRNQDTITQLFWEQHVELQKSIDGYLSRLYKAYFVGGGLNVTGLLSLSVEAFLDAPWDTTRITLFSVPFAVGCSIMIGTDGFYSCFYRGKEPSDEVKEAYKKVVAAYEDAKIYLHAGELSDRNKKIVTYTEAFYVTHEGVIKPLTEVFTERGDLFFPQY